jgi:signal transduction histidine kinase
MVSTNWRVLLVEDSPVYRRIVARVLAPVVANLVIAGSLTEGIATLGVETFDAVLLDLGLPDSWGLQTFVRLQEHCRNTPVVVFSATDDEDVATQAVQLGAQDYLLKDPQFVQGGSGYSLLARALRYAIERYRIQVELIAERNSLEAKVRERTDELQRANIHLRELTASLVSTEENERKRIALELHDEAGQFLTVLQLSLNVMQKEMEETNDPHLGKIREASQLGDVIIGKLRNLAHNLRPPSLDTVGMHQALSDMSSWFGRQSGIAVQYRGNETFGLPGYIQMTLYRMAQESFANILKYAQATQVGVVLQCDEETVALTVSDDGVGFDYAQVMKRGGQHGLGLMGIGDRVEAIGGSFTVETEPGKGTKLSAVIPLRSKDDQDNDR